MGAGANSGVEMEGRRRSGQLYIGQHVAPSSPGLGGLHYKAFSGFCLQFEVWPDARGLFPQATLWPGQIYHQVTEYRFKLP